MRREAIHTPVCLPPTMEGGDNHALQEVNLIKCTSESPHSYALILRVAHRGAGVREATMSEGGSKAHSPCPSLREREPTGGCSSNLTAAHGKVYCCAIRVDAEEKIC
jgi:hypothetical protein